FQAASWEPTRIRYGGAKGSDWVHPEQIVNRRPLQVHELDDISRLVTAKGDVVEVRLPGSLLGYADPSSPTMYGAHPDGRVTTFKGGRVGIAVFSDGLLKTRGFAWAPWQTVKWKEREKAGFGELARTMRALAH